VGRTALAYARVASSDQLSDLETQKNQLASFCEKRFARFELISDLGSGLNYKKPGLNRLMSRIFRREVLLRFGSEIIFSLCKHFGVEVIILEEPMQRSFEQELASDVIEIMTVVSSKLYGRRSHQNRKNLAA